MTVSWEVAPKNLVELHGRLRGTYCFHRHNDGAVSASETSVNFYHTAVRYIPEDRCLRDGPFCPRKSSTKAFLAFSVINIITKF
jgi:hypothetical protein